MLELSWTDKALNWMVVAFMGAVGVVATLIAMLWHDNKEQHKERKGEVRKIREDLTTLELNSVGKDTLAELKEEWREDIRQLRYDFKERAQENRSDDKERHDQNTNKLDKIEAMVVDLHRRLDRHLDADARVAQYLDDRG